MTYQQDNRLTMYRLGAIALGVAIVLVTICGSLGLVWMRQQSALVQAAASNLQTRIFDAERIGSGLEAQLARALSPQSLAARLPQGLRPSASEQMVWSSRPQALSPVADIPTGAMVAANRNASAAASVAAVAEPSVGNSLVADEAPRATVAASAYIGDAPVTVTFDPALLSGQARSWATARR